MKIVKNNYNAELKQTVNNNEKEDVCEHCKSVFIYEPSDVDYGEYGCGFAICPCCGKETALNDEFVKLIRDNIQFPKHFHHTYCGKEGVKNLSDEIVQEYIKECIDRIRNGAQDSTFQSSGDTVICVFKMDRDEEYLIFVSKDTY